MTSAISLIGVTQWRLLVACQPARPIGRGIQVRHHRLCESHWLMLFFQSLFPSTRVTSSLQDRCASQIIPVIIAFYAGIFSQPGRYGGMEPRHVPRAKKNN